MTKRNREEEEEQEQEEDEVEKRDAEKFHKSASEDSIKRSTFRFSIDANRLSYDKKCSTPNQVRVARVPEVPNVASLPRYHDG